MSMPKAKKRTNKRANEVFIVMSVTRESIARSLNKIIDDEIGNGVGEIARFSHDDKRLTKDACQLFADAIADATHDAICKADEIVDVEYEIQRDLLLVLFGGKKPGRK